MYSIYSSHHTLKHFHTMGSVGLENNLHRL